MESSGTLHPIARAQEQALAALARVLAGEVFSKAERSRRFLAHAVNCALDERPDDCREAEIAHQVFDRDGDFDPRIDSLVRVEAGRVRAKLAQHYAEQGARDPLRISLPKGSYVAEFAAAPGVAENAARSAENRRLKALLFGLAAVLAACVGLTLWLARVG